MYYIYCYEFEYVEKETVLGYDCNASEYMPFSGHVLFARNTDTIGEECFVSATQGI